MTRPFQVIISHYHVHQSEHHAIRKVVEDPSAARLPHVIRHRPTTRLADERKEGMLVAKAKGRLKGKPPKLSGTQQTHLIKLLEAGEHTIPELAELFSVSRATVYRVIQRVERARLAAIDG